MKWETWFRGRCAYVLTPGPSADGWFERKESGFGPFGSDIDVPSDVQGETGGPLQGQNSGELE